MAKRAPRSEGPMARRKRLITEACVAVLREASGPLHYREITARIQKRGLFVSRSLRPERCVYSGMSRHIRMEGTHSWFYHAGRGQYGLTGEGLSLQIGGLGQPGR